MPVEFDLFDAAYNEVLAAPAYATFRQQLAARNHLVIGRDNPAAKNLIISERPGDNEDIHARAFVGRSGELPDRIREGISLDTNLDMLIASVVKCKAEIDHGSSAPAVTACLPYLRRQIELVRPQVVLLLGAVALKYLVKDRGGMAMGTTAGRNRTDAPRFFGTAGFRDPAAQLFR